MKWILCLIIQNVGIPDKVEFKWDLHLIIQNIGPHVIICILAWLIMQNALSNKISCHDYVCEKLKERNINIYESCNNKMTDQHLLARMSYTPFFFRYLLFTIWSAHQFGPPISLFSLMQLRVKYSCCCGCCAVLEA